MAGLGVLTQLDVSATGVSTFKSHQTAGFQPFWPFWPAFVYFAFTCRITESLSFGSFALGAFWSFVLFLTVSVKSLLTIGKSGKKLGEQGTLDCNMAAN